jgi:hypothetical protein
MASPQRKKELEKFLREDTQRRALLKRGCAAHIDWRAEERTGLRRFFFDALDVDRAGFVSVEALEEILTAIGVLDGREAMKRLLILSGVLNTKVIGFSGLIDFREFLAILRAVISEAGDEAGAELKTLMTGKDMRYVGITFPTIAVANRRSLLLETMTGTSESAIRRERAARVLKAYEAQLLRGKTSSEARDKLIERKLQEKSSM